MTTLIDNFLIKLKDPRQEMILVRDGLKTSLVQSYLDQEELVIEDILKRLHISRATYFSKKKSHKSLDAYSSEKFIRLMSVITLATEVLGKEEAKKWLYEKIPALGNEIPLNLLDTEAGHRLVHQTLLQIKLGIYS